ncbi:MAG: 3-dehydroquinate dehydratase [Flavobacteriaceae bacterium]|nr:3-dehydroquinate dehydratase [Flavobacteriaceae bacterium]
MKLAIINGPNLNLLGKRETSIYGNTSFEKYFKQLQKEYPKIEIVYFQSNIEGEIMNKLHQVGFDYDGIILNAAAYTHTSIGIGDAIKAITTAVIEVHISNVRCREKFRHKSFITPHCKGLIMGFGLVSYKLAIEAFTKETLKFNL